MTEYLAENASCEHGMKTVEEQERRLRERMSRVKHKIAVISGKGGVGKTMVTVNLAIAFAKIGSGKIDILDADIHGPCVPRMLGMKGRTLKAGPLGAFPAEGPLGIKVVSIDFLLPSQETPVIWRGPLKMSAIRQFLSDIAWGGILIPSSLIFLLGLVTRRLALCSYCLRWMVLLLSQYLQRFLRTWLRKR